MIEVTIKDARDMTYNQLFFFFKYLNGEIEYIGQDKIPILIYNRQITLEEKHDI